jgi:SPP1 gp7 family putative phage head morphogenesis protein
MATARNERGSGARGRPRNGRIEREYAKHLRQLAGHVGSIVDRYEQGLESLPGLQRLLQSYAEGLVPWAKRVSLKMIKEVDGRDRAAWASLGFALSAQLHRDLRTAPMQEAFRKLQELQVDLITSIPSKAAQRVAELTVKGLTSGVRAKEVAKAIAETTQITKERATLIARTETSRAASTLLHVRCDSVGATHYVWRTSEDSDVRPGHKAMSGKVYEWANPPAVNEGGRIMRHHPGEIWNCRCYAEPIVPDPYQPDRRR